MDLTWLFINNLKKLRKEKGISQKVLAERCNTAHTYIRQIESGMGNPSFIFIGKLAQALNIEPYQLFYDKTAMKPEQLEYIKSVKSDFLDKVANELDTAIEKLKM